MNPVSSSSTALPRDIAATLRAHAAALERKWLGEDEPLPGACLPSPSSSANRKCAEGSSLPSCTTLRGEEVTHETEIISPPLLPSSPPSLLVETPELMSSFGVWSHGEGDHLIPSLQLRHSYGASLVFFHLSTLLAQQQSFLYSSPSSLPPCPPSFSACNRSAGVSFPRSSSYRMNREGGSSTTPAEREVNSLHRTESEEEALLEREALQSSHLFSKSVVGVVCGPHRYPIPEGDSGSEAEGEEQEEDGEEGMLRQKGGKRRGGERDHRNVVASSTWWSTPEGRAKIKEELELATFLGVAAVLVPPLHPPLLPPPSPSSWIVSSSHDSASASPLLDSFSSSFSVDVSLHEGKNSALPSQEASTRRPSSSSSTPSRPPPHSHAQEQNRKVVVMETGEEEEEERKKIMNNKKEEVVVDEEMEDRRLACLACDILLPFIRANPSIQVWVEVELAMGVEDTSNTAVAFSSSAPVAACTTSGGGCSPIEPSCTAYHALSHSSSFSHCDATKVGEERSLASLGTPSPPTCSLTSSSPSGQPPHLRAATWRSRRLYQYLREALMYDYHPQTCFPRSHSGGSSSLSSSSHLPHLASPTGAAGGESSNASSFCCHSSSLHFSSIPAQESAYCQSLRRETVGVVLPFLRFPSTWFPASREDAVHSGEDGNNSNNNNNNNNGNGNPHQCHHSPLSTTTSHAECKRTIQGKKGRQNIPQEHLRLSSAWLGEPVAGIEIHPSLFFSPFMMDSSSFFSRVLSSPVTTTDKQKSSRFFAASSVSCGYNNVGGRVALQNTSRDASAFVCSHNAYHLERGEGREEGKGSLDGEEKFVRQVREIHERFPTTTQIWGGSALPDCLTPLHFVAEVLRRGALPVFTNSLLSYSSFCLTRKRKSRDLLPTTTTTTSSLMVPPCPCCTCSPSPPLFPPSFFPSFACLQYLYQQVVVEVGRLAFRQYENTLQLPLQPLADALPSEVYEIFEKDKTKYAQYFAAVEAYIADWCRGAMRVRCENPRTHQQVVEGERMEVLEGWSTTTCESSTSSRPLYLTPHSFLKTKMTALPSASTTLTDPGAAALSSLPPPLVSTSASTTAKHLSSPCSFSFSSLTLPTVYITILGCGRGPLIEQCLRGCDVHGVRACLFAVEKNKAAAAYTAWRWATDPSCLALLQRKGCSEGKRSGGDAGPLGHLAPLSREKEENIHPSPSSDVGGVFPSTSPPLPHQVYVIHSDGRSLFEAHAQHALPPAFGWCDVVVSELLGSLGDNELSPECLEGFFVALQKIWADQNIPPNPCLVSIPTSYTAWAAPVHSTRFEMALAETQMKGLTVWPPGFPGDRHAAVGHQLMVSHLMQSFILAPPQLLWDFCHFSSLLSSPSPPPDKDEKKKRRKREKEKLHEGGETVASHTTMRDEGAAEGVCSVSHSRNASSSEGMLYMDPCAGEDPSGLSAWRCGKVSSSPSSVSSFTTTTSSLLQKGRWGGTGSFQREACCRFHFPHECRVSGIVGFFDAILYTPLHSSRHQDLGWAAASTSLPPSPTPTHHLDPRTSHGKEEEKPEAITLCTLPHKRTPGLYSWFPCVFPLPIFFSKESPRRNTSIVGEGSVEENTGGGDRIVSFRVKRCTSAQEKRVWYTWDVRDEKKENHTKPQSARFNNLVSRNGGDGGAAPFDEEKLKYTNEEVKVNQIESDKGEEKLRMNENGWASSVYM